MRVLVTGVNGQLGYDVVRRLSLRYEVIAVSRNEFDITNQNDVSNFILKAQPDVIVHCAAYTGVDSAEDNSDLCYNVNVMGTKYLIESAKKVSAKILYISTDYVFDGTKDIPYDVNDEKRPISIYGETKAKAEELVLKYEKSFIVRISWVFGSNGNNFVKTMLRLSKEKTEIGVVGDQYGSPTYTVDLAILIEQMINTEKYGTYHATNEGYTTWYEFAKEVFSMTKKSIIVKKLKTSEYPTKAARPKYSCMSKECLVKNGFDLLPNWKDALERYLKEIGEFKL